MPPGEKWPRESVLDASAAAIEGVAMPKGGWLRAIRETLGWPRRVVAEKLGVSPAAVRDYERGETDDTISLGTLRRTARALGCDVVVALVPSDRRSFHELAAEAADRAGRRHRTSTPGPEPVHEPEPTPNPGDTAELESHLK